MRRVNIFAALCALTMAGAPAISAQTAASAHMSVATDPRWTPWLGCWQSDTAVMRGASVAITCVTPVSGSTSVEALSIVDGKIISRKPLDANGKPHSVDEPGCHGDETANWAPAGRRIYLRADYVCASLRASSSSVFAISPAGDWLEVQNVRSDGGSLDRVLRWHETSPPAGLPKSVATSLTARHLAITTARAAAARPITTDDVIEATRAVDAVTVRSWILAAGQRFSLDAMQLAALDRADVPPAVIRAMIGGDQSAADGSYTDAQRSQDDYLRGYTMGEAAYVDGATIMNPYSAYNGYGSSVPYPAYPAYPAYPGYSYGDARYGSYGAYGYGSAYRGVPVVGYPVAPPIIVVRGSTHGRPVDHGNGTSGRPTGGQPSGRPPMLQPPAGRPVGVRPSTPPPPVAHAPVVHTVTTTPPSRSRP